MIQDPILLKLQMARGEFSMLDIFCLPGKERESFCHGVSKICDGNMFSIPKLAELFPVTIKCLCGQNYIFNGLNNVPIKSKKCECGTYVIKYEPYSVH